MMKWMAAAVVLCASVACAQPRMQYHLTYSAAGASLVKVRIDFPAPRPTPVELVMPRNYPGGYSLVLYDSFVQNVRAFSDQDEPLDVQRAPYAPRWILGSAGQKIAHIEYAVDIARMEKTLTFAVESSKVRPRYLGLLGYSVFAFIDGLESEQISLTVDGPPDWPVFTTVAPTVPAHIHSVSASATNYYTLADSEVLMGPDLQLRKIDGTINLVMAVYAEADEDLALESRLARAALDAVQRYFGDTPFPTYTVQLEVLQPLPDHNYNFSQEHLTSGTFSFSTERATKANTPLQEQQLTLANYGHHMAHSWIPKRAYGEGYMPFVWELPPIIDTIWFNEGFGRYVSIEALAETMPAQEGAEFRQHQLDRLRAVVNQAPAFIKRMPTEVLSREASFLYSEDFRIGMNTYARGSLMAAEIDDQIRRQTQGKKSLSDALLALLVRTQKERRPFKIEELAPVFQSATGVDISNTLRRWMQAEPSTKQSTENRVH